MVKNAKELVAVSNQWADKAKEEIASIMKNFMSEQKLNVKQLAEILELDEKTVYNLMKGRDCITVETLSRLLVATDTVLEVKPASETPISYENTIMNKWCEKLELFMEEQDMTISDVKECLDEIEKDETNWENQLKKALTIPSEKFATEFEKYLMENLIKDFKCFTNECKCSVDECISCISDKRSANCHENELISQSLGGNIDGVIKHNTDDGGRYMKNDVACELNKCKCSTDESTCNSAKCCTDECKCSTIDDDEYWMPKSFLDSNKPKDDVKQFLTFLSVFDMGGGTITNYK